MHVLKGLFVQSRLQAAAGAATCHVALRAHHTEKEFLHKHAPTGLTTNAYSFKRLALPRLPRTSPFSPDLMRVTHARPLNPAAQNFGPFEIVLIRVRVPRHPHRHLSFACLKVVSESELPNPTPPTTPFLTFLIFLQARAVHIHYPYIPAALAFAPFGII